MLEYVVEFLNIFDNLSRKYELPRRKRKFKSEVRRYYRENYKVIYLHVDVIRGIAVIQTSFIHEDKLVAMNIHYFYMQNKLLYTIAGGKVIGKEEDFVEAKEDG